jgi:hypothetical protein
MVTDVVLCRSLADVGHFATWHARTHRTTLIAFVSAHFYFPHEHLSDPSRRDHVGD